MLPVQPILSGYDGLMALCALPASNNKNRGDKHEVVWSVLPVAIKRPLPPE